MICGLNQFYPGSCSQEARGHFVSGLRADFDPLCDLHNQLALTRSMGDTRAEARITHRLRGGGDAVPAHRPEQPCGELRAGTREL